MSDLIERVAKAAWEAYREGIPANAEIPGWEDPMMTDFNRAAWCRNVRAAIQAVPEPPLWRLIETAREAEQIIVWEREYGWLLACKNRHSATGWTIKSSGNFYAEMPQSVVDQLVCWTPVPSVPSSKDSPQGFPAPASKP